MEQVATPSDTDTAPDTTRTLSAPSSAAAAAPRASWSASLTLGFAAADGVTRAVHRQHHGPLRVQRMLYPEGPACCHALVLHPPGGVAGGDTLAITLDVANGAHALLTTPGAGKWYRSEGPEARQELVLRVADGGCLEWLPQEAILFDGARVSQHSQIELAPEAAMFGWDMVQLGRLAAGEAWRHGYWQQRLRIERHGRPVWLEQAMLAADDPLRDSPLGLDGQSLFATAWAASPRLAAERDAALAATRAVAAQHGLPCGITWLAAPAELLVARVVGDRAQDMRALLEALWHTLRPWTAGRPPRRPRIWAT